MTRKYFCLWLVMRKEKVKSDKAAKHWIRCSASYMFQRWTSAISALKLRRHVLGMHLLYFSVVRPGIYILYHCTVTTILRRHCGGDTSSKYASC